MKEAILNESLASVLLLEGKVTESASLYLSAQQYFEANDECVHLINFLTYRQFIFISQNNFPNARLHLDKAMELDQLHNGGRKRLNILTWKASCEGWAGDVEAALKILHEATEVEVSLGAPQFNDYLTAIQGRAYYEARMGRFDDARNSIARAIELRRECGADWIDDFMSALIANFSGERGEAISMIRTILDQYSGISKQLMVIFHLALGEMMLQEGRGVEARAQFEQARAICDETGISPKHLYVNRQHCLSLPAEYDGWERFLADAI